MGRKILMWIPKLLAASALWAGVIYIAVVVDPILVKDIAIDGSYILFMIPLYLAVFYTSILVFDDYVSSFIVSSLTIFLVYLSIYQIVNIWSLLVVGVIISLLFIRKFTNRRDIKN